MFVTPLTLIPNPGSEKDVERKQVHLTQHVVASTTTPVLQQTPNQVRASTLSQTQRVMKDDFWLYFVFEDMNTKTKSKFMKYALQIHSSSCTVSQQKSAWGYLLNHIVLKKTTSTDHPYDAMANCMRNVYFNKFRSALETGPIFPLLKSFMLLDSSTQIRGFDVPDPYQGTYSIIEHFKISSGNTAQQGNSNVNTEVPKIPKFPQNTVVKLPPKAPPNVKKAPQTAKKAPQTAKKAPQTAKKVPHTVKECLDAKRQIPPQKPPAKKPALGSKTVSGSQLQKIQPKVTPVTTSTSVQRLNTMSVSSTTTKPIISAAPILRDGISVIPGNSATTNTVVASTPLLADGVNTFPLNLVRLQTPTSNANVANSDAAGVSVSQDDNVINLDEYNKGGGMLTVQDFNKLMLGSMSISVPVIPLQGVIPIQNYQEIASSDSPFFRIGAQDNQPNVATNKQELPTVSIQSFQKTQTAVQNAHAVQNLKRQNVAITPLPTKSNVVSLVRNVEQSVNSGPSISAGQTTIGQVPTSSTVPVPIKSKKRKNTIKETLGPTLSLKQVLNLREQHSMAQGKPLVVQGTQEVIIVSDGNETTKDAQPPKPVDSSGKQSKGIGLEISVSKFKQQKDVFIPPPHHLSLFDSSILKNAKKAQVTVNAVSDPKQVLELEPTSSSMPPVPIITEQEQNEPLNFSKSVKVSGKIRDMIDLTAETPTKSTPSTSEEVKPIDLAIPKQPKEQESITSASSDKKDLASTLASTSGSQNTPLQTSQPGAHSNSQRKILPKPTLELQSRILDNERKLKRVASSEGLEMPKEKVLKLDKSAVSVKPQKFDSHDVIDLSEAKELQEPKKSSGGTASNIKKSETAQPSVLKNSEVSVKTATSKSDSKPQDVTLILPSVSSKEKTSYRTVYTIARSSTNPKSPSKHIPCIITSSKLPPSAAKTESEDNSKRMTASNRWKFSKQRVHVAKREVVVETQHDLLIQPEPTTRRKLNRRKAKKEVMKEEEPEEEEEVKEPPKETKSAEKSTTKQKSPDKKAKPPPQNAFREEKIGNKVYTWVPMKRRVGIMSRSTVDKDGNKVYKSKVKTNKFFSISKKRMMDLGLKGNEGRPLSPSSELENRKKALCKTMKIDDLVDRTNEQAVFVSLFGLISKQKLETACAEISEGRTSRKRQIKAPSRYDL